MAGCLKPIVLLADSQLLFWEPGGVRFLSSLRDRLSATRPRAAYLGASNGDRPEFFELFRGALAGVDIDSCRSIPSRPQAADFEFLDTADLILLAGGDPQRGWRAFESSGLKDRLLARYRKGALLMGISAGAMHLGLWGAGGRNEAPFRSLGLVPFVVDAHDEPEWSRLRRLLSSLAPSTAGLGIPTGGGALVHPDHTVEAVRHPLTEIHL